MNDYNLDAWLSEQDASPGQPPQPTAPQEQPPLGQGAPNQMPGNDPNVTNQGQADAPPQPDVTSDPQAPDMPEGKPEVKDFETWKHGYFKEAIKDDTNKMMELLLQVRDKEGLSTYQKKFVEDNWNIQLLRQNSNIDKACKQIRNEIKKQLDRNNPATSLVNHIGSVLETIPLLNNIYLKLNGYAGLKGDLHRKFISSLVGAVQVGSGANNEDLIYNERDYSISISTRFNARWGDVMIGNWSLREDDPGRYLSEPEQKRLQDGSPMERDALRRRIVIESIAELYEQRAFIINVVDESGKIYTLGWDIANSLRGAFQAGKLVVKTKQSENNEAMINDEGEIIPLVDISINFVKESNGVDDEGKPSTDELRFLERKDGTLFLVADMKLIKESSTSLQGMVYKETPYSGNPSDLKTLSRCISSSADLILRNC
jgi:hypothetical protein